MTDGRRSRRIEGAKVRGLALAAFVFVAAACGPSLSPAPWRDAVLTPAPDAIARQPVLGRTPDSITIAPVSPTGAAIGVDYLYDMPHCGIMSPIDVDGSFWDSVENLEDPVAFDGSSGVFRLIDRQTANYTKTSGEVLRLSRHEGSKTFQFCA